MTGLLWNLERVGLRGAGATRMRLEDVSVSIHAGVTAIIGYSGAGKTSLLNLLVGFERPDAGAIQAAAPVGTNRLPLFWVPQNDGLWPHLTARGHLEAVLPPAADADSSQLSADEILGLFDLREKANSYPMHLSQGERARLSLARALASHAEVLVLDEPLVHVDPGRVPRYRNALTQYCRDRNISLVIATHAPELVLSHAERCICLEAGRVVYAGTVEELYYRPTSQALADFLGAANWLSPEEKARWLGPEARNGACYRPEQIAITAAEESPFIVQSARFAGSVAEVNLLDERSHECRRFFHRPAKGVLQQGDRVKLTLLTVLLCCLSLCGCGGSIGPELTVREVRYWPMPPEAQTIPAPRSLTVGPGDEVYALDTAGRVLVFDSSGQVAREWKMPEYDVGRPEGVCVFKDGRVVVTDTHYSRVVFFDRTGKVLSMSGSFGQKHGQFIYPVGITQDEDENYYVCEYGSNDRVQKFSVDGEFLLQFGGFGTAPGEFQRPSGVLWHQGKVYVADAMNNRIQMFSDQGEFLKIFLAAETGAALQYPYDLVLNPKGEMYVIEYGAGRLSKFGLGGQLLGRFGSTGRGEGQFSTPWGLAVNSAGTVYVADTGNRRIVEVRP